MTFAAVFPNFHIDTDGICNEPPLPKRLPAINDNFMTAYNFLNGNPRLRMINRVKLGSRPFKETLEKILNIYLSNGQVILIMSSLHFKCKRDGDSPNCQFNCDFK